MLRKRLIILYFGLCIALSIPSMNVSAKTLDELQQQYQEEVAKEEIVTSFKQLLQEKFGFIQIDDINVLLDAINTTDDIYVLLEKIEKIEIISADNATEILQLVADNKVGSERLQNSIVAYLNTVKKSTEVTENNANGETTTTTDGETNTTDLPWYVVMFQNIKSWFAKVGHAIGEAFVKLKKAVADAVSGFINGPKRSRTGGGL